MGFETFIAGRHLTRRRKTGFISLISMISVGGVAIGGSGRVKVEDTTTQVWQNHLRAFPGHISIPRPLGYACRAILFLLARDMPSKRLDEPCLLACRGWA